MKPQTGIMKHDMERVPKHTSYVTLDQLQKHLPQKPPRVLDSRWEGDPTSTLGCESIVQFTWVLA